MTGPVTRSISPSPLAAVDMARVRVELSRSRGRHTSLGTARDALADRRLTAAERAAITALVRAVELLRLRARLAGIDDAGAAVKLILRDDEASTGGPWATVGSIAIGARNALANRSAGRARADVLLTVDSAVHELAHVVQFGRMDPSAKPHPAILEGIADSVAMLATDDDTLGEEFFRRDASGRHRGAIRELGERTVSGPTVGGVIKHYDDATKPGVEEHAAGGVVSAAFAQLRTRIGRDRAEQLLWAVIRDDAAWRSGGSWKSLAEAMQRSASTLWVSDPTAIAAVDQALAATGLDRALR